MFPTRCPPQDIGAAQTEWMGFSAPTRPDPELRAIAQGAAVTGRVTLGSRC